MAIPIEIRNVKRPTNTIVKLIGNKYSVIERVGCKRINGKNIPINGSVIGYIIDMKYVPKENRKLDITMKNYGDYIFFNKLSSSIKEELYDCYDKKIADEIYAISLLRAMNNSLKDYQIEEAYNTSFISEDMPSLSLSKNKISTIISNIGKDYSKVLLFIQNRVEKVEKNNKIAIDGMLKTNNSRINSLNDFSYKSRIKSTKDISILIAFNATTKEIICSLPYSGNVVDITSFPDFINKTGINKGIIIGDKGMNNGSGIENIGYIFPIKRSSKIIKELNLLNMDSKLENKEQPILCKKVQHNDKFYYSFRDVKKAAKEEHDYTCRKKFDAEKLKDKRNKFGTIVYVSNQDMTCLEAYNLYKDRWEIELINKFYKDQLGLETVREHSDYSVYGSEFINMLSSIMACRIKNEFENKNLFSEYTYGNLIKILKKYKKIKLPKKDDEWISIRLTKKEESILQLLNI